MDPPWCSCTIIVRSYLAEKTGRTKSTEIVQGGLKKRDKKFRLVVKIEVEYFNTDDVIASLFYSWDLT